MKLIIGLGNPGRKYRRTRHNVGYMFVDEVAKAFNSKFKLNKSMKSEICEINIFGEKVILIKPQTYMNNSGEAVVLIKKYYNIELEDIIVIYDDLDLDVAQVKIKLNGTSAGHKGMKSIINYLHTNDIKRVRIGISKGLDTIDHVLGKFTKDEQINIDLVLKKAPELVTDFIKVGFDILMNKYNGKF